MTITEHDEDGILTISLYDFLLDEKSLELLYWAINFNLQECTMSEFSINEMLTMQTEFKLSLQYEKEKYTMITYGNEVLP